MYIILCSDRETHLAPKRYSKVYFLSNNKNKLQLKITQNKLLSLSGLALVFIYVSNAFH